MQRSKANFVRVVFLSYCFAFTVLLSTVKCAGQQSECSFSKNPYPPWPFVIGNSEEEGDFKSETIKGEKELVCTKTFSWEEHA